MNSLSSENSFSDPWYLDLFVSPEEETGAGMKFDDAIPSSDCLCEDSDTSMDGDSKVSSCDTNECVPLADPLEEFVFALRGRE